MANQVDRDGARHVRSAPSQRDSGALAEGVIDRHIGGMWQFREAWDLGMGFVQLSSGSWSTCSISVALADARRPPE